MYLRMIDAGESLDGKGSLPWKTVTRTDEKLQTYPRGIPVARIKKIPAVKPGFVD
jgi:hypothetical protein